MDYKPTKIECSYDGCTIPRRRGGRYCLLHHAESMRDQRRKDARRREQFAALKKILGAA